MRGESADVNSASACPQCLLRYLALGYVGQHAIIDDVADVIVIGLTFTSDITCLASEQDTIFKQNRRMHRNRIGQRLYNARPIVGVDFLCPGREVDLPKCRIIAKQLVALERSARFLSARIVSEVAHPPDLLVLDHGGMGLAKGLPRRCGVPAARRELVLEHRNRRVPGAAVGAIARHEGRQGAVVGCRDPGHRMFHLPLRFNVSVLRTIIETMTGKLARKLPRVLWRPCAIKAVPRKPKFFRSERLSHDLSKMTAFLDQIIRPNLLT